MEKKITLALLLDSVMEISLCWIASLEQGSAALAPWVLSRNRAAACGWDDFEPRPHLLSFT